MIVAIPFLVGRGGGRGKLRLILMIDYQGHSKTNDNMQFSYSVTPEFPAPVLY